MHYSPSKAHPTNHYLLDNFPVVASHTEMSNDQTIFARKGQMKANTTHPSTTKALLYDEPYYYKLIEAFHGYQ